MRQEILYTKIIFELNILSESSVISSVWILYFLFVKGNNANQMSTSILQEVTHLAKTN